MRFSLCSNHRKFSCRRPYTLIRSPRVGLRIFRIRRAQPRVALRFWKQRTDQREHIKQNATGVPWFCSAAKNTLGTVSRTRARETFSSGYARRGVVRHHIYTGACADFGLINQLLQDHFALLFYRNPHRHRRNISRWAAEMVKTRAQGERT